MLVNRRTFMVKTGRVEEAAKLLKAGEKYHKHVPTNRIYISDIGTYNQVVLELEFENMTEYERFWAEWEASPDLEAFMKKWHKVTKGGISEIWQLVE